MVQESPADQPPPFPRNLAISEHAEDCMWERDVIAADLFAILHGRPLIRWDIEKADPRAAAGPHRLRMTGISLQRRLLTVILELPDENGQSVVVTVFDADSADERRYRAARRQGQRP